MPRPTQAPHELRNTNRWNTRQLATMALFCALSVLLSFIEIPLFPSAPFLKYDPSFVPCIIGALLFGPGAGIAIGLVSSLVHGLFLANWVGALMNIIVVTGFLLPLFLYNNASSKLFCLIGCLILSVLSATVLAIAANLSIGVLFWYGSIEVVEPLIWPVLVPFNLLKHALNSACALVVVRALGSKLTNQQQN